MTPASLQRDGIDFKDALALCPSIIKFIELWHISIDEFYDYVKFFGIMPHNFIEYDTTGFMVVARDAFCKRITDKRGNYIRTDYYSVYIKEREYISVALNKIARAVFAEKFPEINNLHTKKARMYPKCLAEVNKSFNRNTTLSDFMHIFCTDAHITIGELVDAINNPDCVNYTTVVSAVTVYADGSIFIKYATDEETDDNYRPSIAFNVAELFDKDWEAVENRRINNEIDRVNNVYFSGCQKDYPLWNTNKTVAKLKEFFKS